MSRPKGSKNKPKIELTKRKDGSAVINVKMEKQIENMPICRNSNQGYIRWGQRNDYPQRLSDLYYNSVTHKSCVDFAVTAILGDGVDYEAMQTTDSELVPNYQYTWDELIERVALDYVLYGTYAIQIIKNRDDKTFSFFHQPIGDVRYSPRNADGVIESYWICKDWSQTGLNPPVEIKSFTFQDRDEIKGGEAYLFVYDDYSPDMGVYPVPDYISALKPIQTECELERFDYRVLCNNFSASGILTLNRVDSDDEKEMLIQNITSMFSGADNANSLIINFKENDEQEPATFVKIDKDSDSVNLFADTNDRIVAKIVAAHKISNKALLGYEADSAMLGGEGNILNIAFNLYNKTCASKMRRNIVSTINKALAMNGVDTKIILKPLQFNISDTTDTTTHNNPIVDDTNEDTRQATSDNNNKDLDEQ